MRLEGITILITFIIIISLLYKYYDILVNTSYEWQNQQILDAQQEIFYEKALLLNHYEKLLSDIDHLKLQLISLETQIHYIQKEHILNLEKLYNNHHKELQLTSKTHKLNLLQNKINELFNKYYNQLTSNNILL
jgi:hypothetical protein